MNFRYGGKDADLLTYLEGRLEKNPSSSFFAMLSYFYLETGKIAEALSIAQRGVIAHPNYSTGHVVLAMAMMKARLYYDARKELAKAGDLRPGSKMIENLITTLDKQEQADEIGKKLADQFQRNRAGGKDLMKTIEDTIEAYRPKETGDDFIIPGLDAIVGEGGERAAPELNPPTIIPSQVENSSKYMNSRAGKRERSAENASEKTGSTIAKAIIEKVTREIASSKPAVQTNAMEPPDSGKDVHNGLSAESDLDLRDDSSAASQQGHAADEPILPIHEPDEAESNAGDFDLDTLARDLAGAGPIKPSADQLRERTDEAGIELTPEIVTETLAKIFEQQGQIKTAIEAYNILIQKKPDNAEIYRKKITDLTHRSNG